MDLGLEIGDRQLATMKAFVKELIEAREIDLSKHKKIKENVENDKKYAGFPVIKLENQNINEIQAYHEKTVRDLVNNSKRLRAFGAAINLDGSLAANIDRANGKSKKEGIDSPKEKAFVRQVTLDHTQVYRNSTDIEKDMGISREAMYRVDTPDRSMVDTVARNIVAEPILNMDNYISAKYSKWNDKADMEREEREKEMGARERERLERETREEIEYEPFPSILSRS